MSRIEKLRKLLKGKDALLIVSLKSSFPNVYYFTGIKNYFESFFLLITKKETALLMHGIDNKKLDKKIKIFNLKKMKVADFIKKFNLENKRVGIDGNIPYSFYNRLKKKLPKIKFIDISEEILKIRAIKDEDEIKKISEVCKLTGRILKRSMHLIKKNAEEKKIEIGFLKKIADNYCEPAFDLIVAVDVNSAQIHHKPTSSKLKNILLLDIGIKRKNYCSDVSRTFLINKDAKIEKAIKVLMKLHVILKKKIKSGVRVANIDGFAQEFLKKNGYINEQYGNFHALGHGIGIEVQETPLISIKSNEVFKENVVFTIEPAIYFKDCGIRMEDVFWLSKNGLKRLTNFKL